MGRTWEVGLTETGSTSVIGVGLTVIGVGFTLIGSTVITLPVGSHL